MSVVVMCFTCIRNERLKMCSFTVLESELFKFVFKHDLEINVIQTNTNS